jgi:hypothetical protein
MSVNRNVTVPDGTPTVRSSHKPQVPLGIAH